MRKATFVLAAFVLVFSLAADRRRAVGHPGPPTFSKEISRILQENCESCHRPGDIAPFPLISYRDAAAVGTQIKLMTKLRRMPPWKPAEGAGDFVGVRRLSQRDIDLIASWVDAGMPEGNKDDLPAPKDFGGDWVLGAPDLVLAMPKNFTPPADRDEYRCFSIPVQSNNDLWISTVDFRPGDRATVHHILPYIDTTGASAKLDKDGSGFSCFGGPVVDDADVLGGWSPGSRPTPLPEGTAIRLPKGARVLMQVHYHPHFGKVGVDRTEIGLYLAKSEVKKQLHYGAVANTKMFIPAGASNQRIEATLTLSDDIEIASIYPHMHLLGKSIRVDATLPNGTVEHLIDVPQYEFQWQGNYVYRNPVKLPRGTVVRVEGFYDNSDANTQNPNSPPKDVRWGEASTDEMCVALFGYTQ
jgi:copper type II ascorbate-dependent monooxygenase-like protein